MHPPVGEGDEQAVDELLTVAAGAVVETPAAAELDALVPKGPPEPVRVDGDRGVAGLREAGKGGVQPARGGVEPSRQAVDRLHVDRVVIVAGVSKDGRACLGGVDGVQRNGRRDERCSRRLGPHHRDRPAVSLNIDSIWSRLNSDPPPRPNSASYSWA